MAASGDLFPVATPRPTTRVLLLAGALFGAACTGNIGPDTGGDGTGTNSPTPGMNMPGGSNTGGAGSGAPMGSNPPPSTSNPPSSMGGPSTPAAVNELEKLCTIDAAHPRRVLRLSNDELVTTLQVFGTIDAAAIPPAFAPAMVGGTPNEGLTISRDYHENVDAMVTNLAKKIVATPKANQLANLTCASVGDFGKVDACTTEFLRTASAKAFRGMGTAQDVTSLLTLVKGVASRSDGATALEYAVRAMLLNPKSLYLLEGMDLPSAPTAATHLSAGELASFHSYRVLGRPPSDALIAAVKPIASAPTDQALQQVISAQFKPEDLQKGAATFFSSWMKLGDLTTLDAPGFAKKHRQVDAAYLQKAQTETYQSIVNMLKQPGVNFTSMLTTDQRSVLAGDSMSMAISAVGGRPGIFTLPGVLMVNSNVDHTNIPRRGRFILKELFCEIVPPPPDDLTTTLPALTGTPSERQRFEHIEKEPRCGACHLRVNRPAFTLEGFNELGVARTVDEHNNPIDTATPHSVGGQQLMFKDAKDMFTQASTNLSAQNCLAVQTFRHVARRFERGMEGKEDACIMRDIAAAGRMNQFQILELFKDALVRTALAKRG